MRSGTVRQLWSPWLHFIISLSLDNKFLHRLLRSHRYVLTSISQFACTNFIYRSVVSRLSVCSNIFRSRFEFALLIVFNEMKFALNALPETLIGMLQSMVSLRRIENYLNGAEVKPVPPLDGQAHPISLQSATVTWPQDRSRGGSTAPSTAASTPRNKFVLLDLNLDFPRGELSLICGKLGSGKTLLLLGE